jgi:hypothetical protein
MLAAIDAAMLLLAMSFFAAGLRHYSHHFHRDIAFSRLQMTLFSSLHFRQMAGFSCFFQLNSAGYAQLSCRRHTLLMASRCFIAFISLFHFRFVIHFAFFDYFRQPIDDTVRSRHFEWIRH